MKFIPIASSSRGNAYRLQSEGGSQLLIECGIKLDKLQQAFNFKLTKVDGVLISHEHADHSVAVKDLLKIGLNVYMTEGTRRALDIEHRRIKIIEARKQFKIGEWTIMPFDVEHDAEEPVGFLIQSKEGEKLLFATDTFYIRYKFKGLSIIAVECNFSEDILNENIKNEEVPVMLKTRLMSSHFSFENYMDFLKNTDMEQVREIWLLHMSHTNSDEYLFKKEVQKLTGKPTYIA